MYYRRFGNFSLGVKLIQEHPDLVKLLMGKCIITRCEFIYCNGLLEYTAICDDFRELNEGEPIPTYKLVFGNNNVYISEKNDEKNH